MTSNERHNAALNICGESLWGFQTALAAPVTVLPLLLLQYGAQGQLIGAISAIESVGWFLPQLVGVFLFTSQAKLKRNMVLYHYVVIIPLIFCMAGIMGMAGVLSAGAVRWGLLGCYALYIMSMGVVGAVWFDWMGRLFRVEIRGMVLGVAFAASAGMGALAALLSGKLIAWLAAPGVYAGLYAAAGVVAVGSITCFLFIRDPQEAAPAAARRPSLAELLGHFRASLRGRNFRAYLVGRILAAMGGCFVPFIAVHFAQPEGGALRKGAIVAYGAAFPMGQALSCLVLGHLGDRYGHRLGVLAGTGAQVGALLTLLLVPAGFGCMQTYALIGLMAGAGIISHNNMLLETCPHQARAAHLTLGNFIVGIMSMVAPLLAGSLAYYVSLRASFWFCLVLSGLALAWYLGRLRDPRMEESEVEGIVDIVAPTAKLEAVVLAAGRVRSEASTQETL